MDRMIKTVLIPAVAVLLVLVYFSVYTVDEREYAIKFRLGEVLTDDIGPGLHFKTPFINNVRKLDRRVQTLDADPQRFLTAENKNLIVDSFVKWRITDPTEFYVSFGGGNFQMANSRLREIVQQGLRDEFGQRTVNEVISGERAEVMRILRESAEAATNEVGIEVLDVRIKRVDLPEDVNESIFERMAAARERVARELRALGEEAGERIRAEADRRRTVILAEAYRDAERMRGEGDAQATATYAAAYDQEPDFYSFYRSLEAYTTSFRNKDDMLVLSPDNEFFRYFNELQSP
ncbi:protease modulator HflC [Arhodomonas sp. SL1]|uniref:protease modulator HflC n=1 Tax=Arhodomonas sp. SL1 TaxID=3425691 RepID=UPI003F883445